MPRRLPSYDLLRFSSRRARQNRLLQFQSNGYNRVLTNGGALEKAAAMASHANTRTAQPYRPR
jgi:hypothetical protein